MCEGLRSLLTLYSTGVWHPLTEYQSRSSQIIINVLDYRSLYNIRLVAKLFASFISPIQLTLAFQISRLRLLVCECQFIDKWLGNHRYVLSRGNIADKYTNDINTTLQSHLKDYECGQEADVVWSSMKYLAHRGYPAERPVAGGLPCYFCLKHVPRSNFVPSQRRNKRAFGKENCIYRVCNECVTRKKKWANDDPANIGRVCFRMCERCNKVEELQTAAPGKGRRKPLHVCDQCYSSRHNGWNARNSLGSLYGHGLGGRASRCQRCWHLRDEERPGEHEHGRQLMCSECFAIATKEKGPDMVSEGMEWLTKTMSRVEVNGF